MAYRFDPSDVAFLRSAPGRQALERVARLPLTDSSRLADTAAAREVAGERYAAAVLETVALRRRAGAKLRDAAEWLFTDTALQQATTGSVAAHRAARLAGRDVHDVTCSIGADLAEIAPLARSFVGSDRDEVRLHMARGNLAARGVEPMLVRADALRPVTTASTVVADPGRRDGAGRRKWSPEDLEPPLRELVETYRDRDLVVKCAPGLDFEAVPERAEIELVSLAGQVREASLWFGELAEPGVRRGATLLDESGGTKLRVTDVEPDDCPERAIGEWLVDPDGAVVRAGLVRQYAARYGLGQLDHRIAYLTGKTPPPGVRAFRVLEHGKYNEKSLRALLRSHDVGRLEILVRGLDVDPDALRRRLKLSGDAAATVVLTRVGRTPTAILCQAGTG
ncbi:THUMP-like domain-containing protein [Actinopolyspora sp. H202]|uniref:THUMP-like domain-containing protein n=1 Tax=Actinopolyspora sp. H202 TaxID=1500456 RepID=UPI003EE7735B